MVTLLTDKGVPSAAEILSVSASGGGPAKKDADDKDEAPIEENEGDEAAKAAAEAEADDKAASNAAPEGSDEEATEGMDEQSASSSRANTDGGDWEMAAGVGPPNDWA